MSGCTYSWDRLDSEQYRRFEQGATIHPLFSAASQTIIIRTSQTGASPMTRFVLLAISLALAIAAPAQNYEGYVDVLTCKVKPEKRSDFDAINKKMANTNRRYRGDTFLASQIEYGEQNTVIFTSVRDNYAAIEK